MYASYIVDLASHPSVSLLWAHSLERARCHHFTSTRAVHYAQSGSFRVGVAGPAGSLKGGLLALHDHNSHSGGGDAAIGASLAKRAKRRRPAFVEASVSRSIWRRSNGRRPFARWRRSAACAFAISYVTAVVAPVATRRPHLDGSPRHAGELQQRRRDHRRAASIKSESAGVEFTNGDQPGIRLKKG
jgi:hypothetical protein